MTISLEQCRIARTLLRLTQAELAELADIAKSTLADFERGASAPTRNNLKAIRAALEQEGIAFIDGRGGAGARLRSSAKDAPKANSDSKAAVTPEQVRAARTVLDLSQIELADKAGVGRSTVADFETGARTPHPGNLAKVRTALEAEGIAFIAPDASGGPGVTLKG